ncbi:MAG: DegT/DnrJ/EryC1/StrS family aminotransferase [Deltaproteobacteria bacterium]|nr:DegT/DnrJ/EryC1/StrS family aminotransferase [Deltaproteobacteria bacterium]
MKISSPPRMKIPLLDLARKYRAIEAALLVKWSEVFSTMRLLNGSNLAAFEQEFAAYCGVKQAIGVASGTDAIYLSLLALGISREDEVILPAHAPAPVIEPIVALGAVPVLVDKASGDYGPDLDSLRAAITSKTKGIIAVHLLGLPCDMDEILKTAEERKIPVIEDSSQAQGATYKMKRAAGFGVITPMSLGPVKNLACYGDGGVVLTNDDGLARTVQLLRVHGQEQKYDHRIYGWNSRLDEIQAAALRVKLPMLDQENARRREIAEEYSTGFRGLPLKTPPTFPDRQSVYHQYAVETPLRDRLKIFLQNKGIGTGIYYPVPLHQHAAWKAKGQAEYSLPEAERFSRENLALPVFAELRDEETAYVVSSVKEFFSTLD